MKHYWESGPYSIIVYAVSINTDLNHYVMFNNTFTLAHNFNWIQNGRSESQLHRIKTKMYIIYMYTCTCINT